MRKALLLVLLLTVAFSFNAWALDTAYHVKQAPNGKGDLLIFPMFFTASNGWETKITVINTSPEYSVIAKVIYNSHYWTDELLDHLIYLSPNDVWIGYVRTNNNGVYLYSNDDSIVSTESPLKFGNEVAVSQPFFTANMCNAAVSPTGVADSPDRGYIEVIETWFYDTTSPIAKKDLYAMYNPMTGPVGAAPTNRAGTIPGVTGQAPALQPVTAHNIDHTINVLSGTLEIQNSMALNYHAAMEATVFADFDLAQYLTVVDNSNLGALQNTRNTLGELEAALTKNAIAMPYINKVENGNQSLTIHAFNFPTKQAYAWDSVDNECDYEPKGPYWVQHWDSATDWYDQCVAYTGEFYDLSENTRQSSTLYSGGTTTTNVMCEELEWVMIPSSAVLYFEEGWQRYTFLDDGPTYFLPRRFPGASYLGNSTSTTADSFQFTGIPVIPFALYIKGQVGLSMFYGSSTDGEVFAQTIPATGAPVAGTWLPDYQYWNYMEALGLNDNDDRAPNAVGVGDYNNGNVANLPYAWYPVDAAAVTGNWTVPPAVLGVVPPIEFPSQQFKP